jgi:hypothetical protein
MGLLDDAIREHLELKRLRGANPSEVTREEQEALGLAHRVEDTALPKHLVEADGPPTTGDDPLFNGTETSSESDLPHMGQETVELDMRAILDAESIDHNSDATPEPPPRAMSAAPPRAHVDTLPEGRLDEPLSGMGPLGRVA